MTEIDAIEALRAHIEMLAKNRPVETRTEDAMRKARTKALVKDPWSTPAIALVKAEK